MKLSVCFTEVFWETGGKLLQDLTVPVQNLAIPSEVMRDVCTFDWSEISGEANCCLFIARSQCL